MKSFSAKILKIGINPYVLLPAEILKELFRQSGKSKGPIPVKGTLNGKKFIQTLVKYSGKWRLYLNTPMRRDAGIDVGDMANVKIAFDPKPRVIEMHPRLAQALKQNKNAKEVFEKFSLSQKRNSALYKLYEKRRIADKKCREGHSTFIGQRTLCRERPMTKGFVYRQGAKEDMHEVRELGIISYGEHHKALTEEHWKRFNDFLHDEKTWIGLLAKSESFVCVSDGKIIGMAYLIPSGNPTAIYPAGWSYVRMLGVHPDYAGQGIGKRLMNMCIDKAKEMSEKGITLHTSEFMDAARHLYESMGFRVLKEIPPRYGKRYWLYKLDIYPQ